MTKEEAEVEKLVSEAMSTRLNAYGSFLKNIVWAIIVAYAMTNGLIIDLIKALK